uniref:hypothetical protein n=1 Tax=Streptomyces poonensis TaxID=68255 RepID=UPI003570EBB4
MADSRCRPLGLRHHARQAGDVPALPQVMARTRVPRLIGRPRAAPDVVLAGKAYSSRAIRAHLRRRRIRAVIPQPAEPDRQAQEARPVRRQAAGLHP